MEFRGFYNQICRNSERIAATTSLIGVTLRQGICERFVYIYMNTELQVKS